VSNSSQSVAALALSIIQAANAAGATPVTGSQSVPGGNFVSTGTTPATVTGGGNVTVGVLAGQNAVFETSSSTASLIVAGNNTNSSIVNNNANGSLIAFTGAGGNALVGGGLINGFQTGVSGQDSVVFGGGNGTQINLLNSQGQDSVNIVGGGPGTTQVNEIVAIGQGSDAVNLLNGASLTFINLSTATSVISASAGSTVNIGGTGNTSVTAGAGSETFSVNTASGNVTLTGSVSGADTFNFVNLAHTASTSVDVVGNFTSSDTVNISGYGAGGGYLANVVNGSTVLTLSDGTQVIFAGITNTTQVTSRLTST
jgi:hypothetical protein